MTQKNKTKIFFRADANETIGLGHVIRSVALASYLKDEFQCVFVIRKPTPKIIDIIESSKISIVEINNDSDFINFISDKDIVVLDGYDFNFLYQTRVKNSCFKLVCIDDIANRKFYCDIIINHAEGLKKENYDCQPFTKIFIGFKYALLRKPFLCSKNNKSVNNKISSYFICFGGSDSEDFTRKTLEQLVNIDGVKKINIVIGGGYQNSEDLNSFCETINICEVNLYQDVDAEELVSIIEDSHLAIVPSSSIAYEVLSANIPIISGYSVANQKGIYNTLVGKNLVLGIGKFPIKNLAKNLKIMRTNNNNIKKNQANVFDGKSSERLLNIFKSLDSNRLV
jgi:UDP-2,4-diacetamido-2,4,6-trideoxy-beta-L-altropyranose hydrolase